VFCGIAVTQSFTKTTQSYTKIFFTAQKKDLTPKSKIVVLKSPV